jgi:3,4-dihydroxy 2-butanone 4-phosphate synthase/GTP cyclohydrolase II
MSDFSDKDAIQVDLGVLSERPLNGCGSPREHLKKEILSQVVHSRGAALDMTPLDSPCYGSTICLGSLPIQLEYGEFKIFAFETMKDGNHVLALTMGDVSSSDPLLIRMHSECVTSETLHGCDCDCVEQLNAALKNIAEEGRGVLFYLRQEGRGAGYASKSRDRMSVAASEDSFGTFDAYEGMGLMPDPRSYGFMSDVVYLLDITAPLRVMTNNPHKLEAIEATGLTIQERCQLTVPANPFNLYYLQSKSEGGHLFEYGAQRAESHYPWQVSTFKPYVLNTHGALRFVHMASYPLPIRPRVGFLMLEAEQLNQLSEILGGVERLSITALTNQRKFKVEIDKDLLVPKSAHGSNSELIEFVGRHPYWFNDHVYHDRISGLDYVALTYETDPRATPIIRVHSESLFGRFPLKENGGSLKYELAIQEIVENGRGMLLLYPEDGRGKGFSALFLEKYLAHRELVGPNNGDAVDMLGCSTDERDFLSIAALVRHHYPDGTVRLLLGGTSNYAELALQKNGVQIVETRILG